MNELERIFRPELNIFWKQIYKVVSGISIVFGFIMIPILGIPLIENNKFDDGPFIGVLLTYGAFVALILI